MGQVRGVSVIGTFRYLRQRFGEEAPARALAALTPEARKVLGDGSSSVVESSWYDTTALSALTREIDRLWGRGDLALAREIGRDLAFEDMNRFFKWLLKLVGPKTLFTRAASVWNSYHSDGLYVVEAVEEHRACLRVEGWTSADAVMCKRVEGWMERALELTLSKDARPTIHETHHLAHDPAVSPQRFCRYLAEWL